MNGDIQWQPQPTEGDQSSSLATGYSAASAPTWDWETIYPGGVEGIRLRNDKARLHALIEAGWSLIDELRSDRSTPHPVEPPEQARTRDVDHVQSVMDRLIDGLGEITRLEVDISLYLAGQTWAATDDQDSAARYLDSHTTSQAVAALTTQIKEQVRALAARGALPQTPTTRTYERWIHQLLLEPRPPRASPSSIGGSEEPHRPTLSVTGGDAPCGPAAWTSMYEQLAGSLSIRDQGGTYTLGQAASRLRHPSADVRRRTHDALHHAWNLHQITCAAALNALKGEHGRIVSIDGWNDDLAQSAHRHNTDPRIITTALEVLAEARHVLGMFASAKAQALGLDRLAYCDIAAPLPAEPRLSWPEAVRLLTATLEQYHPPTARHLHEGLAGRWIDAEPRPNKRPQALCLPLSRGTRIMLTFDGTLDALGSLAHEHGHSYHYHQLRHTPRPLWPGLATMEIPSQLFAGLLGVIDPTRSTGGKDGLEKHCLHKSLSVIFNALTSGYARLLFEQRLLGRRRLQVLTPRDLEDLMVQAQIDAYPPQVHAGSLPTHTWMSHPHLFTSTLNSWSYLVGLLFSLAIAPDSSRAIDPARSLDGLLAGPGLGSPRDLRVGYGIDPLDISFWSAGLEALSHRVAAFAAAVPDRLPDGLHASTRMDRPSSGG